MVYEIKILAEKPDVTAYLKTHGLEFSPCLNMCLDLENKVIGIGSVIQNEENEGTVVGFCPPKDGEGHVLAIVFDESKEGQGDAISTIDCHNNFTQCSG